VGMVEEVVAGAAVEGAAGTPVAAEASATGARTAPEGGAAARSVSGWCLTREKNTVRSE
jgi:hypothetical protein